MLRVATPHGVLKTCYSASDAPVATVGVPPEAMGLGGLVELFKAGKLEKLSLRTALSKGSKWGGQGMVRCACKGPCATNSCSCKASGYLCTSRCHANNANCTNHAEAAGPSTCQH